MKKLLLSAFVLGAFVTAQAQDCSDLIISKIMVGKGNTKAMEFYNPTATSINLTTGQYCIQRYKSVSATGVIDNTMDDSLFLLGVVPAYGTWVICNGQTAAISTPTSPEPDTVMKKLANQLDHLYGSAGANIGQPMYYKGNDCMVLRKNGNIIDVFGEVNTTVKYWSTKTPFRGNTGAEGSWISRYYLLERKASVKAGRVPGTLNDLTTLADVNTNLGFQVLNQYDTIPQLPVTATRQDTIDVYKLFGSHTCDCASAGITKIDAAKNATIYPNPSSGMVYISTEEKIKSIEIYNLQGVRVDALKANSKMVSINSESYGKGIYFIKTLTESGKTLSNKVEFN